MCVWIEAIYFLFVKYAFVFNNKIIIKGYIDIHNIDYHDLLF